MTHIEYPLKEYQNRRQFLLSCNLALIVLVQAIEVCRNLFFQSSNLKLAPDKNYRR